MPYNSEELRTMRQVIEGVQGYYSLIRDAERARLLAEEEARRAAIESAEAERRATIDAARACIPPSAYEIPLSEFGLSARVLGHLERAGLTTVGSTMELLAEGDEGLLKLDGIGPKSMAEIKQCISELEMPQVEEVAPVEVEEAVQVEAEVEAVEPVEPALEAVEVIEEAPAEEIVAVEEAPVEEEVIVEEAPVEESVAEEVPVAPPTPEPFFEEEEEEQDWEAKLEEERKRERRLRRQLVLDEESGELVAHRRRKRARDDWDDYLG